MGDSASPLLQRRRLRTELRTARLNKELTQEKAKTGISTNDLKVLLPLYGITDTKRTQELLDLARAARQPGWWQQYSDVAPGRLLELIDFESAASAVHQFETTVVPGILQTEEYASAILQEFQFETLQLLKAYVVRGGAEDARAVVRMHLRGHGGEGDPA